MTKYILINKQTGQTLTGVGVESTRNSSGGSFYIDGDSHRYFSERLWDFKEISPTASEQWDSLPVGTVFTVTSSGTSSLTPRVKVSANNYVIVHTGNRDLVRCTEHGSDIFGDNDRIFVSYSPK